MPRKMAGGTVVLFLASEQRLGREISCVGGGGGELQWFSNDILVHLCPIN